MQYSSSTCLYVYQLMIALKYCVYGLAIGAPVAVAFHDKVGGVSEISGRSMRPTLNPDEMGSCDKVWVRRWGLRTCYPQPGDIITITSPLDPSKTIIKRVIATEGAIIKNRKHGHPRYVRVPPGHCWVEGDNERSSQDSNDFGPISQGLIKGYVTHIIWPLQRRQVLLSQLVQHQKDRVCAERISDEELVTLNTLHEHSKDSN